MHAEPWTGSLLRKKIKLLKRIVLGKLAKRAHTLSTGWYYIRVKFLNPTPSRGCEGECPSARSRAVARDWGAGSFGSDFWTARGVVLGWQKCFGTRSRWRLHHVENMPSAPELPTLCYVHFSAMNLKKIFFLRTENVLVTNRDSVSAWWRRGVMSKTQSQMTQQSSPHATQVMCVHGDTCMANTWQLANPREGYMGINFTLLG